MTDTTYAPHPAWPKAGGKDLYLKAAAAAARDQRRKGGTVAEAATAGIAAAEDLLARATPGTSLPCMAVVAAHARQAAAKAKTQSRSRRLSAALVSRSSSPKIQLSKGWRLAQNQCRQMKRTREGSSPGGGGAATAGARAQAAGRAAMLTLKMCAKGAAGGVVGAVGGGMIGAAEGATTGAIPGLDYGARGTPLYAAVQGVKPEGGLRSHASLSHPSRCCRTRTR